MLCVTFHQAALQAVLGAYMSDGGEEDSDVSACTPPPVAPPQSSTLPGFLYDDTSDQEAMITAELNVSLDLQKKIRELRNKVEQERIDVSSGSERIPKRDTRKAPAEEPKVVTILDSDEEEELARKKRRDDRRNKKRKRSRYLFD